MKNINIIVENKKATVVGLPVITCGNSDYTVTFAFDDEWNLTGPKTARFVYVKRGEVMHEDVVFEGNTVAVPVLSDVAFVNVGVFAGDLSTTTPARVACRASILCGSGAPHDPTPDVYNQIMTLFNSMAEKGTFGATEAQAQQIEQNRRDIAALEDGTKEAGKAKEAANAEKLGGHEAEYFAPLEAVKNNELWNGLTSGFDLNNALGKYRTGDTGVLTSLVNAPKYSSISGTSTGEVTVEWFPSIATNQYGVQTFKYSSSKRVLKYIRERQGTTWGEWERFATDIDLANYFKNTGGTIDGNVYVGNSNKAQKYENRLRNANRNLSSEIDANGNYAFWDSTNSDYVFQSTADGTNAFNGTASGNVPITGGTVRGSLSFRYADNGHGLLVKNNSETQDNGMQLSDISKDGKIVRLFLDASRNRFRIKMSDMDNGVDILHTGNSAKVHIGTSAPSDTSSVWFDTSEL